MDTVEQYIDKQLSHGRAYFDKKEACEMLPLSPDSFSAAATRLVKKRRLISPKRGFYIILRPEDRVSGAPDPVRWINPLMDYLNLDYRISLLRAAAFHGASHQAVMVFQVIVPKQLRVLDVGRHRIQFVYQSPLFFNEVNQPDWLDKIKSEAGFAKAAGVELTLLDSVRYFHKVGGMNGAAQIVHDLGAHAGARKLAKISVYYENSVVRRLGYLLELFGYHRQASLFESIAKKAKSMKNLDPSSKPVLRQFASSYEENARWMLVINEPVEIDF
jgi:predicted transcriptional regulator of viral defense system